MFTEIAAFLNVVLVCFSRRCTRILNNWLDLFSLCFWKKLIGFWYVLKKVFLIIFRRILINRKLSYVYQIALFELELSYISIFSLVFLQNVVIIRNCLSLGVFCNKNYRIIQVLHVTQVIFSQLCYVPTWLRFTTFFLLTEYQIRRLADYKSLCYRYSRIAFLCDMEVGKLSPLGN